MSELVKKLRSYPSATCKDEDIAEAADRIESQDTVIHFWKDRLREALAEIKDNIDRIAEVEAALQPFAELGDNFSDSEVMESIRHARKVLGEK